MVAVVPWLMPPPLMLHPRAPRRSVAVVVVADAAVAEAAALPQLLMTIQDLSLLALLLRDTQTGS